MNGTINAVNDIKGDTGIGIYINGYIQNQNNAPIINLNNSTNITSTGVGIYSAGYATYNINGASISGTEAGLAIKSGIFNILDASIKGIGKDKTPTSGNNDGINPSGVAIQIESNPGYSGDIELVIKNGTFTSENSHVIYEYTTNNNSTEVNSIKITGGSYVSKKNKNVFLLSNSFKNTHPNFISGGTYSSDPTDYLKNGYSATLNSNNLYEVVNNSVSTFSSNTSNNSTPIIIVMIIILLIGIGTFIYFKRDNIFNFINSIKAKTKR